jgi:hypothetical protein
VRFYLEIIALFTEAEANKKIRNVSKTVSFAFFDKFANELPTEFEHILLEC